LIDIIELPAPSAALWTPTMLAVPPRPSWTTMSAGERTSTFSDVAVLSPSFRSKGRVDSPVR
jgi:hypothetical protein